MTSENDLIKKLMISKQIMDKHKQMPRSGNQSPINEDYSSPNVQEFQAPQAKYSLPEEFMTQSTPKNYSTQPITEDRVMSSKLPDEIKRLMIEHPINQPSMSTGPTLSNDLVEKASRLMNTNAAGQQTQKPIQNNSSILDIETIRNVVKETVEDILRENGLLTESESKTNELLTFKVGKHIFEGKVTKIKKIR